MFLFELVAFDAKSSVHASAPTFKSVFEQPFTILEVRQCDGDDPDDPIMIVTDRRSSHEHLKDVEGQQLTTYAERWSNFATPKEYTTEV